jgi:hypothetical protein
MTVHPGAVRMSSIRALYDAGVGWTTRWGVWVKITSRIFGAQTHDPAPIESHQPYGCRGSRRVHSRENLKGPLNVFACVCVCVCVDVRMCACEYACAYLHGPVLDHRIIQLGACCSQSEADPGSLASRIDKNSFGCAASLPFTNTSNPQAQPRWHGTGTVEGFLAKGERRVFC